MNFHQNGSDSSLQTIPIPVDPYEEWLSLPVPESSPDPRFEVRRAEEHEFELVYDCVDAAFGKRRPRPVYDWMYRDNPYGRAQCWITLEKATGRILKTGANFPWPIRKNDQEVPGTFSGDSATIPEWQRKGLSHIRRVVRRSHPWQGKRCGIAGPNENSRIVSRKDGQGDKLLGRLPGGLIPLRAAPQNSDLPRSIRHFANGAIDAALRGWQALALPENRISDLRVEVLPRFSPEFDSITLQHMQFRGYWCPHSWEFLNWRYLDHPVERSTALTLLKGEEPCGYAVVRHTSDRAMLTEFAVGQEDPVEGSSLIRAAIKLARDSGCSTLAFFSTPAWRHWRLFRKAGMIPAPTNNHLEANYDLDADFSRDARNWQLTPGDRDYH